MVKNHLKRINAPATWQVERKLTKFIARQHTGGHSMDYSMPLSVILSELLHVGSTRKEQRFMLAEKSVLVNQKQVKERNFSVGLFDTIALPLMGMQWRIVMNRRQMLECMPISAESAKVMVGKVIRKDTLRGGKLQVSTMNGQTMRVKEGDKAAGVKTGDTIVMSLPEKEVREILHIEDGARAFVFKGSHTGKVIIVGSIVGGVVSFKDEDGPAETRKDFMIVIGKALPEL